MTDTDGMLAFGPVVDSGWLSEHISDPGLVVADVRWYMDGRSGRDVHESGHIPGSVYVDLDTDLSSDPTFEGGRHPLPTPHDFARAMSLLGIGDGCRVVVYDDASGAIASRLWWMLDALGVEAAVLDGGIGTWAGDLETDPVVTAPADFTVTQWPADRVASINEVEDLRHGDAVVIDARGADRFAAGSGVDPRAGHVPGARSAPFADNLADGLFKSAEDLRRRYESLGAGSQPVVAYCGSGVTACHDLLALRRAGLGDGRLFVGSWSAWGADTDRPAEEGPDQG